MSTLFQLSHVVTKLNYAVPHDLCELHYVHTHQNDVARTPLVKFLQGNGKLYPKKQLWDQLSNDSLDRF